MIEITEFWTRERDEELIRLRESPLGWGDIARVLGNGRHECARRYRTVRPPYMRPHIDMRRAWPHADTETLKRLVIVEKKTIKEASLIMGRGAQAIHNKLHRLRHDPILTSYTVSAARITIPSEVLADRDRRLAAPRDLTAVLCGDPAPGQSALDQRVSQ